MKENFSHVYDKFKLHFYTQIFHLVKEREGSLSAMEAFSLEVIKILGQPTISEFADFLNISQSNATYKVNMLIRKGYIEKENSAEDRREYHLVLSDKYYQYQSLFTDYQGVVLDRVSERFSKEDVEKFNEMLRITAEELMPECSLHDGT